MPVITQTFELSRFSDWLQIYSQLIARCERQGKVSATDCERAMYRLLADHYGACRFLAGHVLHDLSEIKSQGSLTCLVHDLSAAPVKPTGQSGPIPKSKPS